MRDKISLAPLGDLDGASGEPDDYRMQPFMVGVAGVQPEGFE